MRTASWEPSVGAHTSIAVTVAPDLAEAGTDLPVGNKGHSAVWLRIVDPFSREGGAFFIPHACLPSRRQQAGSCSSGSWASNGVISGVLIKTVNNRAMSRSTFGVYSRRIGRGRILWTYTKNCGRSIRGS